MLNTREWLPILVVIVAVGFEIIASVSIKGQPCEIKHNPDSTYSEVRTPSDYRSSGPAAVRVTAVYSQNFKRLHNYWNIASNYVEPGLDFWRSALKVRRPLNKPLKLKKKCQGDHESVHPNASGQYETYCTYGCASSQVCYNVEVPRQYLDNCKVIRQGKPVNTSDGGSGAANTDYLVFVDYKSSGCGGNTLAYAIDCQKDKSTDRPEIGIINYCPHNVRFEESKKRNIKYLTIHELGHAFGFSWYNVPYMRNEDNTPRTRRDPTWNFPNEGTDSSGQYKPNVAVGEEVTRWWLTAEKWVPRTTKILKTPTVLAVARAHFNCPTLEGVEFENNGGSGTASAHFEKHLFYDEVMVGSTTGEETVSELTLGFFKDTGWYDYNKSAATPIKFGKGLGCDFATKSCYQYVMDKQRHNQSTYPWCDKVEYYCNLDRNMCTLRKMTEPLPEAYRYIRPSKGISKYEANYYAGVDWLMDYCPYITKC